MGVLLDFIFDNTYGCDAAETEKEIRGKYPLLLHENEKVELAFRDRGGKGRDREFFTSHRILIKDGKGIGNKRKNYRSIPYSSIEAFYVRTAGQLDDDVELKVWSSGGTRCKIDFATAKVDIFQMQQFLNTKIAWSKAEGNQDAIDATPPNMDQKQSTMGNAVDWLGDNAKQIDAAELEQRLKSETPILLANEKVQIAFKSGRDTTCFTDKRVLLIDVQGITGKQIKFKSVLWSAIHAFSVQTAGAFFDRDTELKLYTKIMDMPEIKQDLRNGKANLFALQKVLCNHVLGEDKAPLPEVDRREGEVDPKGNWWFRDNQRPLDAVEMDKVYHSEPPILQGSEVVEFAFKGRRDITMFTTKRLIIIDPKGLVGKQIQYTSVPWKSIVAFGIRTAGKYFDFDTEVIFSTEMDFIPGEAGDEDSPPIPAEPYMSQFELDFNKNYVDMYKLKYYLSKRILLLNKMEVGAPIPLDALTFGNNSDAGLFNTLLGYIGGDQLEIDANALDQQLHTSTQILLDGEKCIMAFKAGRDISIFTNLRIMLLDVQGLSGQKIEYTSIPLRTIRGFACETAGIWDTDSELKLRTKNRWHLAKLKLDFRTGKADIIQINKFLSALIIGLPGDPKVDLGQKNYANSQADVQAVGMQSLVAGFFQNSKEVDAIEIDTMLRTSPALLLEEEKVLKAFKQARDMFVYTNRRMIIIDTQGLSGKRVSYETIPYKWVKAYEFETAGNFDADAEIYLYTDISEVTRGDKPRRCTEKCTKNSVLVKYTDIYEMGKIMNDNILMRTYKEEPEIDIDFAFDVTSEPEIAL